MLGIANFDWNSFWVNIYAGFIYFILGILFSIWLIPRFTLRLIRGRNKKYLNRKMSSIVRELCEFLISSQFRDKELNQEHISIFSGKRGSKNYAFVGLCPMNVFSPITYPKIKIVIHEFFEKLDPDKAYTELSQEYSRLKIFRKEIETLLTAHSLYLDDDLALRISDLCSDLRGQEINFLVNYEYQDLLEKTQKKRTGVFGVGELFEIYEKILLLIRDLTKLKNFEYTIDTK
jgi:hypothetical protein